MNAYTVHAFRYGDRERHSYIVGVYIGRHQALAVAEKHEAYRGGKYSCEVCLWRARVSDWGEEGLEPEVIKEMERREDVIGTLEEELAARAAAPEDSFRAFCERMGWPREQWELVAEEIEKRQNKPLAEATTQGGAEG